MSTLTLAKTGKPNFAPAKGVLRAAEAQAQDTTVFVKEDWFKTTKQKLQAENKSTWDSQSLLWEMIFLFVEGKQLLKRSRYGQGWRVAPLPDRTDSPVYALNLVGFYADNIKSKWTQSTTDINWRPVSDEDKQRGAAKAATHIQDYYQRRLYTERFRQTEATLALCGKYARYVYYSEDVKAYARKPVTEQQPVQFGDGYWFCADCGAGGSAAELGSLSEIGGVQDGALDNGATTGGQGDGLERAAFNAQYGHDELAEWEAGLEAPHPPEEEIYEQDEENHLAAVPGLDNAMGIAGDGAANAGNAGLNALCPNCGSPNLDIEEPAQAEIETVTGFEQVETGDIVCEQVPAFELKHELTKTPQDSSFLIRTRRIRTQVLKAKFPQIAIKPANTDNRGLGAMSDLKRSQYAAPTPMLSASDDQGDEQTTDFIQIWLDPSLYNTFTLKEDFETVSGQTIPAGTSFAEVFPTGMYMAFIEGVDGCVELRDEHHRDFWVGSEYRMRAISSLGSGIEDMIEGQRQYNLIMSIIYTQLRTSAMPATLYDARLLPNGVSSYLGSLQNIPVELSALDDRVPISAAVHQLSPQPPSAAHFQEAQQLDVYLQKASRITDIGFGAAMGREGNTATQAELAAAQQQGLFAPQLALKAEVDRRCAEIILRLFREHSFQERYVALSGKRGEQDGIWLSQSDLSTELLAEIAPGSYLPQTNLERRERWRGLLADVGGLAGLKMAMTEMPALLEQLAELYDVDLGSEDFSTAAELCAERVQQMEEALPMLQMMAAQMPPTQMRVDPMTGEAVEVPVDPMAEAGQFLLGVLQPPIELEELGHLSAIHWCREWLTTDVGKKAPAELRAGVKAMIQAHLEGLMTEAQMTGMIAMAGQPMPAMPPEEGGEDIGSPNKNKKAPETHAGDKKARPKEKKAQKLTAPIG